jgi:hypothetical protein
MQKNTRYSHYDFSFKNVPLSLRYAKKCCTIVKCLKYVVFFFKSRDVRVAMKQFPEFK